MIYWYDYIWFFGLLSLPALVIIVIERLAKDDTNSPPSPPNKVKWDLEKEG